MSEIAVKTSKKFEVFLFGITYICGALEAVYSRRTNAPRTQVVKRPLTEHVGVLAISQHRSCGNSAAVQREASTCSWSTCRLCLLRSLTPLLLLVLGPSTDTGTRRTMASQFVPQVFWSVMAKYVLIVRVNIGF